MERKTKIVMITMFKNESKVIRRMLESCYEYIDYWVVQDNGSTDGTDQIVKDFFEEKGIPGHYYRCKEGWIGFGWNRDHLLQTCLNHDHGCDWILKMDCDEYLEVDDDFDWSLIDDTNIQAFHITAENPGCTYYRAWMWNARLPWHFKHDVAHECIVCDIEGVGEDFQRVNLPRGLRQMGTWDGESYATPTKYISDSLKLEEQHIREGTLLSDTYHFWYVAKSYLDASYATVFPLGFEQQKEYARRAIFYFRSWMNHTIDYDAKGYTGGVNEMAYYTLYCIGMMYQLMGDYEKAIESHMLAEPFCDFRNEHIVGLAECYRDIGDYESMRYQTERLVDPERKLPFPQCYFLVNNSFYIDSGNYGKELHQVACQTL
jgi:glycosyltransferase involved in cell wall biosynthesis